MKNIKNFLRNSVCICKTTQVRLFLLSTYVTNPDTEVPLGTEKQVFLTEFNHILKTSEDPKPCKIDNV